MFEDIKRGKIGEEIFIEDFLKFLNINYQDVTGSQQFQIIDTDLIAQIGMYEIKTNYRDDRNVIIEEFTNINQMLAPISKGWFYKSKADILVFISKVTRAMVLIPFNNNFRSYYETIKNNYPLNHNRISIKFDRKWESAFRVIPLDNISGFYAMYKRI